jgi:hypothetical protein
MTYKTRVKVEDITGVSLTTWGTSQQKGHLPVGDSLLGQIVEDDDGVHAVVPEVLSHGNSGVRSKILERSGVRGGGGDDNGVPEREGLIVQITRLLFPYFMASASVSLFTIWATVDLFWPTAT